MERTIRIGCLALWLGLAWAVPATADNRDLSPESIDSAMRVDAEGLIDLHTEHPELLIIDARLAGDRKFGYIEDSISLPDTETSCDTLSTFIPEPDSLVAFYCNGPKCGRSANSVRIAVRCGYRKVYWFRGGIEEWSAKQYPLLR